MIKNLIVGLVVLVAVISGTVLYRTILNTEKSAPPVPRDERLTATDDTEYLAVGDVDTVAPPPVAGRFVIDLSGQGLTKAPMYIFEKTATQELNLSNNNLEGSLQAEVRHLQELRILDLSDNQFTGLPAEVGQLKKLEVLDLSNNDLTGLPYELGNLQNLTRLDLRGNAYAQQDLETIKSGLPAGVQILVD